MALVTVASILFIVAGCYYTHIRVENLPGTMIALLVVLAGIQAIPAFWHSLGKANLRDASMTLPWFAGLLLILPYIQDIASRVGRNRILQDENFARIDEALGVHVPGMMMWASRHTFGPIIFYAYFTLVPFLFIGYLLPALTGKVEKAEQFLTSNYFAMIVSAPIFTLYPAVGPWYGYHFAPGPGQVQCQSDLLMLRQAQIYLHHRVGVVCCPSGHVLEAIICAYSLWDFRFLRIPAVVVAGLIIFSTMITGWHYFFDVIGGAVVGVVSILVARWLTRRNEHAEARRIRDIV